MIATMNSMLHTQKSILTSKGVDRPTTNINKNRSRHNLVTICLNDLHSEHFNLPKKDLNRNRNFQLGLN